MILMKRLIIKKKQLVYINLMNNLFLELFRKLNIQDQLSIIGASLRGASNFFSKVLQRNLGNTLFR